MVFLFLVFAKRVSTIRMGCKISFLQPPIKNRHIIYLYQMTIYKKIHYQKTHSKSKHQTQSENSQTLNRHLGHRPPRLCQPLQRGPCRFSQTSTSACHYGQIQHPSTALTTFTSARPQTQTHRHPQTTTQPPSRKRLSAAPLFTVQATTHRSKILGDEQVKISFFLFILFI